MSTSDIVILILLLGAGGFVLFLLLNGDDWS